MIVPRLSSIEIEYSLINAFTWGMKLLGFKDLGSKCIRISMYNVNKPWSKLRV